MREYVSPFFESLKAPELKERGKSPTSYTSHSEESWALVLAFPHFGGILIEKAMRGDENLLSSEQVLFKDPDKVAAVEWTPFLRQPVNP
jgi:hypothetical protein